MASAGGSGTRIALVAYREIGDGTGRFIREGVFVATRERILIVDDDPLVRNLIQKCLHRQGYESDAVDDGLLADRKLQSETYQVVISDVKLPGMDGLRLLSRHGGGERSARWVMVSGQSTIGDAVEAMKLGAFDFLAKPFRPQVLQDRVQDALSVKKIAGKKTTALIGDSPAFQRAVDQLDLLARVPTTVLLTGDTGTGKDVAARYLHDHSARRNGPFVSLHCSAVPDNLLEDELFGHIKGAFTGAVANRAGCFEMAHKGTLFLDEIGTMSLSLQSKFLRILQNPEVRKLGDTRTQNVDVRLIAATNSNLEEMVRRGEFRADLYYRLSVFPIHLPRLAERGNDILLLAQHFSRVIGKKLGMEGKTLSPGAEAKLLSYGWPGNVRHLENSIERAVVLSRGRSVIETADLHLDITDAATPSGFSEVAIPEDGLCFDTVVGQLERQLILKSLQLSGGNKKHAAELLRLKRTTLIEKLKRLEGARAAS